MIYKEYEEYKEKYYNAQKEYDKILTKKEELFNITQPKATTFDKERVSGGKPENTFDSYLAKKEQLNLDDRLYEAYSIMEQRKTILYAKLGELKASANWYDRIYYYKYVDNLSVKKIEQRVPYCRKQIYRILEKINENMTQNVTKIDI